ncbi:hypothetical protein P886_1722 [Alteromonadaceae bacterium 2753L.S.0a.02]|nr:hypothetical protein P886_1722 [Alteromonadaceae bacterium 2753L.S.0a.02]
MIAAQAHQVQTLRLKSNSRESLGSAVNLLEEALRLACSIVCDSSVMPPSDGALIFVRKITLGKFSLNTHAQQLADAIAAQIERGVVNIACVDFEDNSDADIVWFSDALIAWSRLLARVEKTCWYWPLTLQHLGVSSSRVSGSEISPDLALKMIEHSMGAAAIAKLLRELLARNQLLPFVLKLDDLPSHSFADEFELSRADIPTELSSLHRIKFEQFLKKFSQSERAHLAQVFAELKNKPELLFWLLQTFSREEIWLQQFPRATRVTCYAYMLKRIVEMPVAEQAAGIQKSLDTPALELGDQPRQHRLLINENPQQLQTGSAEGVKYRDTERLSEHASHSSQGEFNAEAQNPESTGKYHAQSGIPISYAGVFFILNLFENLIPDNCHFVNLPVSPKKMIFACLLQKLRCEQVLAVLDLDLSDYNDLLFEPLRNCEFNTRWQRWLSEHSYPVTNAEPDNFGDWQHLVIKTVSRFLWRETGGGIKSLSRLNGDFLASHTHIDIFLESEQLSLTVRKLGLDISPGWLPWLQKVVAFHYRGAQVHALYR